MTRKTIPDDGPRTIASLGLRPEQLPRHVAVIMDGNGRWAQNRGKPRIIGHRRGIASVRAVVEEGCKIGLEQLTLYCLSVENWKRPPRELTFLLRLFRHFLVVVGKLLFALLIAARNRARWPQRRIGKDIADLRVRRRRKRD